MTFYITLGRGRPAPKDPTEGLNNPPSSPNAINDSRNTQLAIAMLGETRNMDEGSDMCICPPNGRSPSESLFLPPDSPSLKTPLPRTKFSAISWLSWDLLADDAKSSEDAGHEPSDEQISLVRVSDCSSNRDFACHYVVPVCRDTQVLKDAQISKLHLGLTERLPEGGGGVYIAYAYPSFPSASMTDDVFTEFVRFDLQMKPLTPYRPKISDHDSHSKGHHMQYCSCSDSVGENHVAPPVQWAASDDFQHGECAFPPPSGDMRFPDMRKARDSQPPVIRNDEYPYEGDVYTVRDLYTARFRKCDIAGSTSMLWCHWCRKWHDDGKDSRALQRALRCAIKNKRYGKVETRNAYKRHLEYDHGVSSVTCRPLARPKRVIQQVGLKCTHDEQMDGNWVQVTLWAFCENCNRWQDLLPHGASDRKKTEASGRWFAHSMAVSSLITPSFRLSLVSCQ